MKCGKCLKPITGGEKYVEALNKNWHSQCFTCTVSVYLISVILRCFNFEPSFDTDDAVLENYLDHKFQ